MLLYYVINWLCTNQNCLFCCCLKSESLKKRQKSCTWEAMSRTQAEIRTVDYLVLLEPLIYNIAASYWFIFARWKGGWNYNCPTFPCVFLHFIWFLCYVCESLCVWVQFHNGRTQYLRWPWQVSGNKNQHWLSFTIFRICAHVDGIPGYSQASCLSTDSGWQRPV